MIKVKQFLQDLNHRSGNNDGQQYVNLTSQGETIANEVVVFVVQNQQQKEFNICKKVMIKRSPYFRELIANLEQGKVRKYKDKSCLQLVRILLPKWVRADFFETFLSYLELEEKNRLQEGIALFTVQPLEIAQRLLWLADFFQISDIQRFLIFEVIVPRLTTDYVLTFLGDVMKKLKNLEALQSQQVHVSADLDTWRHFHDCLLSYISANLPHLLLNPSHQTLNEKTFNQLSELLSPQMTRDLIESYLLKNHDLQILKEVWLPRIQDGRLFFSEPISQIGEKGKKESKQLLWEVNFNKPQPQSAVVQEKHSHTFEIFNQYHAKLRAKLESDGRLTITFAQLKHIQKEEKKQIRVPNHVVAKTKPKNSRVTSLESQKSKNLRLPKTQVVSPQFYSRNSSLNQQKRPAQRPKSQSLCSPIVMKFSQKDILSQYQNIVLAQQQRSQALQLVRGRNFRSMSVAPQSTRNIQQSQLVSQKKSFAQKNSRNNQQGGLKQRAQTRPQWGSNTRQNSQASRNIMPPLFRRCLSNDDNGRQISIIKNDLKQPNLEALLVGIRVLDETQQLVGDEWNHSVSLALNPLLLTDLEENNQLLYQRDLDLGTYYYDQLSFKLYISIERSALNQLCLSYLLANLEETLHEKTSLLGQLKMEQLGCLFKVLSQNQKGEDTKIKILNLIATEENIAQIEDLLLPLIDFNKVSTSEIIDIIKSNAFQVENVGNSPSYLSKSFAFKQHFKNQLRMRKEATFLPQMHTFNPGTPDWGYGQLFGGYQQFLKNQSSIASQHQRLELNISSQLEDESRNHHQSKMNQSSLEFYSVKLPVKDEKQKALEMSEKLAISILNSPINYEAKKRRSIQGSSPANNTFQSMHRQPSNGGGGGGAGSSAAIYNTMMIETGNFYKPSQQDYRQLISTENRQPMAEVKNNHVTSLTTSNEQDGYFTSVNSPTSTNEHQYLFNLQVQNLPTTKSSLPVSPTTTADSNPQVHRHFTDINLNVNQSLLLNGSSKANSSSVATQSSKAKYLLPFQNITQKAVNQQSNKQQKPPVTKISKSRSRSGSRFRNQENMPRAANFSKMQKGVCMIDNKQRILSPNRQVYQQQANQIKPTQQQFYINLKALSDKLQSDIDQKSKILNTENATKLLQNKLSSEDEPSCFGMVVLPHQNPLQNKHANLETTSQTFSGATLENNNSSSAAARQSYLMKQHHVLLLTNQSSTLHQTFLLQQPTLDNSQTGTQQQQQQHRQIIVNKKNHVRSPQPSQY